MMKITLIALGTVCLWFGFPEDTDAHKGDRIYPFYELTDEDLLSIDVNDGSVGDWLEVVGDPALVLSDFAPSSLWASYDPSDFDYRIWLGWNQAANRIYVAMERTDDIYVNKFNRNGSQSYSRLMQFHDSSINFWVDAAHRGGPFFLSSITDPEERLTLLNQKIQFYTAIAEVFDEGPLIELWQTAQSAKGWFSSPPYMEGGGRIFGEGPTVSITEFYVTPFDFFIWNDQENSEVSLLYPGKTIGFAFQLSDYDTGPGERKSGHSVPVESLVTGEDFADGVLLGVGGVIPEDTVVESGTWARIKAAFAR
jgi:hypothetical protein